MYEFHKQRSSLGTIEYSKVRNPLYDNLYSTFNSVKETKVVKEVVEDIQDKIVDLSKKDEHILFPDIGALEVVEEEEDMVKEHETNPKTKPEDIKTITVSGEIPKEVNNPDDGRKKIVLDPDYKVGDDK
jgi:nucleoid DNA-binding protein